MIYVEIRLIKQDTKGLGCQQCFDDGFCKLLSYQIQCNLGGYFLLWFRFCDYHVLVTQSSTALYYDGNYQNQNILARNILSKCVCLAEVHTAWDNLFLNKNKKFTLQYTCLCWHCIVLHMHHIRTSLYLLNHRHTNGTECSKNMHQFFSFFFLSFPSF